MSDMMHRFRLKESFIEDGKTIKLVGSHTIRRGRKTRITIRPGEVLEAYPHEIGKKWLCRFEDLGPVRSQTTSRRKNVSA